MLGRKDITMPHGMTDIVDRLKAYADINDRLGAYTEANCAYDAIQEIEKLRNVADEAADEIEKLRGQIRIYKDLLAEAAREIEALKNNK